MGSIRKASDQEYWIAIQRLWTFEEPSSRWLRLCKSMAKVVPATYAFEANATICESQQVLFREVYGPANFSTSCMSAFFALSFALAEIERYQDEAFRFCSLSNEAFGREQVTQDRDTTSQSEILMTRLVQAITSERRLSPMQCSFVSHSVKSMPDWTRLLSNGLWLNDSRVEFVRRVLKQSGDFEVFRQGVEITVRGLLSAYSRFEQNFLHLEASMRSELPPGFLPKRLLLVEGATEQILLPHFAECIASDWNERAVLIIPAGGANQVVRRYPQLREQVKLPIDCVLDGDVASQAENIAGRLKNGDSLYVLASGAIEEAFPRDQIVELVNAYFDITGVGLMFTPVTLQELDSSTNQESLERLWRKRNRGSFDKTGFARVVAESITTAGQIPVEIRNLISNLCAKPGPYGANKMDGQEC